MLKKLIMWAFLCATAPFAFSQNTIDSHSTTIDTADYSIPQQFLNEVVVKASPVINNNNRKVIRPSKETLRTATGGIDLLRKLQLSLITVNPLTNSIEVAGGGDVVLCINGIESTSAQIAAIKPQEIQRIEYHDKPGIRYAGATVVIDYITSRHDYGGNLYIDAFEAYARGRWASIDQIAGQYNHGNSIWTANVNYFGQQKDKWVRDYDEVWYYPDATVKKHENGIPVTVSQHGLESAINYNNLHASGNILNIRLGFNMNNVPNEEEGDRKALLQTSILEDPIFVAEHTERKSITPNLGIYYHYKLSENRSLLLDARTSYMHSQLFHEYHENGNIESDLVTGNRYAAKLLGMYEYRNGSRVLNIAVSNNNSFFNNTYFQDQNINVNVVQSETAIMGEYSTRFGNWGAMGNMKIAYRHLGQQYKNLNKIFISPEINLSYRLSTKFFFRYTVSLDYKMPAAAEISNVRQSIQLGMIRRGNPELQPFRLINQSIDASYKNSLIDIDARIEYRNENKPIMESVRYENAVFVKTFSNQRSFQRLILGSSVTLRPWKDHLSIMAAPRLARYFSHGLEYRHCHNIFRVGLSVDFSYNEWLVYGNIMSGPANYMYGEEIIEEKDMNQIMIGYKRNNWSLHLGVFNAFMRNYWMTTRNMSSLAPYTSMAHSGRSSSYIAVKFSLSLNFGQQGRETVMHENDIDNDSGILTGTK
ncbi:MAG: TonB-dependent receptor [Muribaculaceae bacterium]|nr:TonB-dependent receptor [Muribaculaceae bacterium]